MVVPFWAHKKPMNFPSTNPVFSSIQNPKPQIALPLFCRMLKFLSKIKIEFNAKDPRSASCIKFLALCNSRSAKESNKQCEVGVKRRTDEFTPRIAVTFVDGAEKNFDAASMPAEDIQRSILEKAGVLEAEQIFREAGEKWPVQIPEEELRQTYEGLKVRRTH